MKRRPLSITLIGLCYVFVGPIFEIWSRVWFNEWPLLGNRGVLTHMTVLDWAVITAMPVVGYGILRVARWGYYLFLAYSATMLAFHYYMFHHNPNYSFYTTLLFSLFNVGLVGFFMQKHVAAPYFSPKMKWWERDPRFSVHLPVQVRIRHALLECHVVDLGMSGCFVDTHDSVSIGDVAWLRIQLGEFDFTALGRVVWVNHGDFKGVGLQFVGMGVNDKRVLKKLIRHLIQTHPGGLKVNQGVPQRAKAG